MTADLFDSLISLFETKLGFNVALNKKGSLLHVHFSFFQDNDLPSWGKCVKAQDIYREEKHDTCPKRKDSTPTLIGFQPCRGWLIQLFLKPFLFMLIIPHPYFCK